MSTENSDLKTYFGRCRCCLHYGYLKSMWKTYHCNGDDEVYGKMLTECYVLSWEHPESVEHDQICEPCIEKLRGAYNFRKLVIESQTQLMLEIANDMSVEQLKVEDLKKEERSIGEFETVNIVVENGLESEHDLDVEDNEREAVFYEDVEYLEEETLTDTNKKETAKESPQELPESKIKKTKWPKKLPPNERNKRYLQYTADDIQDAIRAVRSNQMTKLEASQFYKVPKKTLENKIKEDIETGGKDLTQHQMTKFLKEIKTILTYTNATPYKSKSTQYACMYCDMVFGEPDDLRNHTRTLHMDHRTKRLDIAMRPHWLNEIVKLDIQNLLCVACCILINDWNAMLQHLKETHQVNLDQAYNRIIPYSLDIDLKCVLCGQQFLNYLQLDGHMNTHYNNYVCLHCGDTFLTQTRLKRHLKIHSVEKWPCRFCHKVFNTQNNVKKHEDIVHKCSLYYKCPYCQMRFSSDSLRREHVTETHSDKVKVITCELCGKIFNWRHYYVAHMRKVHSDKKFKCPQCDKRYTQKNQMKAHFAAQHRGEKRYNCIYCDKQYSSRGGLVAHRKQHLEFIEHENI